MGKKINPDASRSLLENALLQLRQMRSELEAIKLKQREPIAIIGMGCRFPGGANTPQAFWQLLHHGVDAVVDIPSSRWDVEAYYDSDPDAKGKMYVRRGGFLDQVDQFDPLFFGITPREAASLDPQQRLLLEVSWEALENAGLAPNRLTGSQTGVFVGAFWDDYSATRLYMAEPSQIDGYRILSNLRSLTAGRLSYVLGLQGPTMQLDTACSSSLLAIHLACQSLRNQECDLSLAGGVNLILSPEVMVGLCRMNALAPDGRCKTFDAQANGFAKGEGCGIVVLKRLSDAITDGDHILALIRGSAVNHDGRSNGITVPNGMAQEALLRQALQNAAVEADQIQYVEAHGTGTVLGDPIEVFALGNVLGQGRQTPLAIGSVKTNLGHLDSAAGVAGVMKVILALQHEEIPPHLHFSEPNPHIPWHDLPITVPTSPTAWPSDRHRPRLAGISSFGMSGTNVHLIVEEAPQQAKKQDAERPFHLLTLSAKSQEALIELAKRYSQHLTTSTQRLSDICFTANTGRAHFTHRLAVTAKSKKQLHQQLSAFTNQAGQAASRLVSQQAPIRKRPKIAFMFPGQGAQSVNMAKGLYEVEPTFREVVDACSELLTPHLGLDLREVLYPKTKDQSAAQLLSETWLTQPALFVIEYAQARLLLSWGLEPEAMIGHSIGEYVAACLAGVLSMPDALALVAARGRLMQQLPSGSMLAVFLPSSEVQPLFSGQIELAAENAPSLCVVSGPTDQIERFQKELTILGIDSRLLRTSHAFHSSMMDPILHAFTELVSHLTLSPPQIPYLSNVTGNWITAAEATEPSYWAKHLRQPVRFAEGIGELLKEPTRLLLEVGPGRSLSKLAQRHATRAAEGRVILSSQTNTASAPPNSSHSDVEALLKTVGQLWQAGIEIDWKAFYAHERRQRVPLPTYPFQRERYWVEAPQNGRRKPHSGHPLLQERLYLAGAKEIRFQSQIGADYPPYLTHHRVYEKAVLPATAYLEMALAAGAQALKSPLVLEEVLIQQALLLPESGADQGTVQLILRPDDSQNSATGAERQAWQIYATNQTTPDDASWTLHASGYLLAGQPPSLGRVDLASLLAQMSEKIEVEAYYQSCGEKGLDYGPSFQAIEELWRSGDASREKKEALGQIRLPDSLLFDPSLAESEKYLLHPVLLDGCLQVLGATFYEKPETYMPLGLERLTLFAPLPNHLWSHAQLRSTGKELLTADLRLFAPNGQVVATLEGLQLKRASRSALMGPPAWQDWLYEVVWQPQVCFLPPEDLPTPEAIVSSLESELVDTPPQLSAYNTFLSQLEHLSVTYVGQALQKLGFRFSLGQRFSTADVARQLGIVDSYQRLLNRLLEMLAEVGTLRQRGQHLRGNQGSEWEVIQVPERSHTEAMRRRLLERYPSYEAEVTLLARCGEQLAEVLRGTTDPLQLLFPEGDLTTAARLYQESPAFQVMNRLVREVMLKLVEGLPPYRGVRILEIGAGTGGTTSSLLPHLPANQTDYLFTDIGTLFIAKAQEKFADYPFVRYQTLDIEQEPEAAHQGQYDLIVAANVLHATKDLRQTLKHVHKMLAPGGMLLLLEATARQRWVDLTFGLTEGWWRFTDHDLRPDYPLLTPTAWQEVLGSVGFKQPVTLSPLLEQGVIVARKAPEAGLGRNWLILADDHGIGAQLATLLTEIGDRPTLVYPNDSCVAQAVKINPTQPADYQRLVGDNEWYGVIHLWSLDSTVGELAHGNTNTLDPASQHGCGSTLLLLQSLEKASSSAKLWLVTQGAQAIGTSPLTNVAQSSLWGMGKVIALEHPDRVCARVDLDPNAAPHQAAQWLLDEIRSPDRRLIQAEDQIAFREQNRYVARLTRLARREAIKPNQPFRLEISQRGTLGNLSLVPTTRRQPGPGEVEIRVYATGLNFLDVLDALGMLPQLGRSHVGGECAGQVVAVGAGVELKVGDAVVGLADDSFSQYVTTKAALMVPIPEGLTYDEAATIPVNFLTAYVTLHQVAKISAGDKVLIHAATGGTGMAAVQLAQQAGAEVFGTASQGKWPILRSNGVKQIYNSRTLDFAEQIMADTNGEGVDIVLNSLTGEGFVEKSLSVLASGGRFVEIAKRNIWELDQVAAIKPDISYDVVDLLSLTEEEPTLIQSMLRQLMAHFAAGTLKPLPRQLFPIQDVVSAFRTMQQAKHIGKIVVTQPEQKHALVLSPRRKERAARFAGSLSFDAQSSYLITGGLGGLGLWVARFLAEHGAGHLVLIGRSQPSPAVDAQIKEIEEAGAKVVVVQADVTKKKEVAEVLAEIKAPLKGVIHAAGVLDDGILEQQTLPRFAKVIAPKVQGAWHLHTLTKQMPLDFFVLFSSVASLLGSKGQANHAAANAFLDGLAFYRSNQGLPALSINWGGWSEIGAAAQRLSQIKKTQQGVGTIAPKEGLEVLSALLSDSAHQVGVLPVNWSKFLAPFPSKPALLSSLLVAEPEQPVKKSEPLNLRLEELPAKERHSRLSSYLGQQVAKTLALSASQLDRQRSLTQQGLDSLMAIELRNLIKNDLGIDVPMVKLLEGITVATLALFVDEQLSKGPDERPEPQMTSMNTEEWIEGTL